MGGLTTGRAVCESALHRVSYLLDFSALSSEIECLILATTTWGRIFSRNDAPLPQNQKAGMYRNTPYPPICRMDCKSPVITALQVSYCHFFYRNLMDSH